MPYPWLDSVLEFIQANKKAIAVSTATLVSFYAATLAIRHKLAPMVIFPRVSPSYDHGSLRNELIFIPKGGAGGGLKDRPSHDAVTCRLIRGPDNVNKMLIYFHGNGEDIGTVDSFVEEMCEKWQVRFPSC